MTEHRDFWAERIENASATAEVVQKPLIGPEFDSPPCRACAFWRPTVNALLGGRYPNGVTLCHGEQEQDFSCFRLG